MKSITRLITCLLFFISSANAQLIKQWDFRYGGTAIDEFHDIIKTSDGGYLVCGYSESGIGGDKSQASRGSGDFWILKINAAGTIQWDKRFGGTNYDELFEAQETFDGGFILGGWSNSGISGDKSQASQGAGDYWIVKTDALGNLQFDKTFGGSFEDYLQSIKQTSDSGFILAGRSNSGISGDKTQANRGTVGTGWDYWVVKINKLGVKQWDKTYGGTADDQLFTVHQTTDGGYILGGYSDSPISGEKSQNTQGLEDYWMIKTDASGNVQWDKTFGGTSADQLQTVLPTSDGGYLLGGGSASGATGDKSQASRGNFDYWVLKTNSTGTKQWDKRFGGSSADNLFDLIETTEGGYLMCGASASGANGDKSQGNQGTVGTTYDYWSIKIDAAGIAQTEKRFGGSADDYAKSLIQTSDGSFIIGGWSTSGLNGDKSQASRGSIDYWITKVSGANSITTAAVTGPKCAGSSFSISYTVTGSFVAGNIFTAQLSDASGSFAAPTVIGSVTSTSSGSITVSLPALISAGTNYQIQVISSNPISQDIYPCTAFQIDTPIAYYVDGDNDTYGTGVATLSCTPIAGWVTDSSDCNDSDPLVHSLPSGNDGANAASLNCEGSSGNIFNCFAMSQATSYQWILSAGLSSAVPNNITLTTSISISIALGASNDSIGIAGKNSCGLSDTLYTAVNVLPLPGAAGNITGSTLISSCTNQLGIPYNIVPISNADNYVWALPSGAIIIGNADSNEVVVDYPAYGFSGNVSVYATNVCGSGASSNLAITYENIPSVELCYITVDSATQKGLLWWQKPIAAQSDSIVIMRKNKISGIFEKLVTIKDTVPTSYLDTTSNPGSIAGESYQMAIKDTCGNVGSFSTVITHKTIYLYGLLGWSNYPKLYWTPYEGINDTARYYRVMRDETGNGPFQAIDSLPYNAVLNYTDTSASAPSCLTCRYLIEMVYSTNCSPTNRIMLSKNTSRSNIKNKVAMPFDSTLLHNHPLSNFNLKYNLVPNPTTGNCILSTEQSLSNCQVSIYNLLGEEVWKFEQAEVAAQSKINLPLADFSKGTYVVKIRSDNAFSVQKIIRQ